MPDSLNNIMPTPFLWYLLFSRLIINRTFFFYLDFGVFFIKFIEIYLFNDRGGLMWFYSTVGFWYPSSMSSKYFCRDDFTRDILVIWQTFRAFPHPYAVDYIKCDKSFVFGSNFLRDAFLFFFKYYIYILLSIIVGSLKFSNFWYSFFQLDMCLFY